MILFNENNHSFILQSGVYPILIHKSVYMQAFEYPEYKACHKIVQGMSTLIPVISVHAQLIFLYCK